MVGVHEAYYCKKKKKVCCGKQGLERIKKMAPCHLWKKRIGRIGRDTHVICSELLSWTSPVYWMQHVIQTHFVSMFSALKKMNGEEKNII